MLAAGNIAAGRSKVAIAGGFESMSNVPFYMKRGDTPYGIYHHILINDYFLLLLITLLHLRWLETHGRVNS